MASRLVERIKKASRLPARHAGESLADAVTGALAEDDTQLSKFHGSYQQDDRDLRNERRKAGEEYAYSFMIRLRLPGGDVHPGAVAGPRSAGRRARQRHAPPDDAPEHSSSTAILKSDLQDRHPGGQRQPVLDPRRVRRRQPQRDGRPGAVQATATTPSSRRRPGRSATHLTAEDPRLRGALARRRGDRPGRPDAGGGRRRADLRPDVPAAQVQDRGDGRRRQQRRPVHERSRVRPVPRRRRGRGLERLRRRRPGRTHRKPATFPRLADALGFVRRRRLLPSGRGRRRRPARPRRSNQPPPRPAQVPDPRPRHRLVPLEGRGGHRAAALAPARPVDWARFDDLLGWHEQGDGAWFYGLRVFNGRVRDGDDGACSLGASGHRAPAGVAFRITPNQNVYLVDVAPQPAARDRWVLARIPGHTARVGARPASVGDGLPGAADLRPRRGRG